MDKGRLGIAPLLVAGIVLAPCAAHAQLLGRASSAVRDGDASSSRQSDDDDDRDSGDSGGGGGSVLGSASHAVRDGGGGGGGGSYYDWGGGGSSAPAFSIASGATCPLGLPYMLDAGTTSAPADADSQSGARIALRLDTELGYVIAGAARAGFGARLQLPLFFDLTARYSVFFEPTNEGIVVAALGRIGADFRIVDDRWIQLRVGGGLRHFHDDLGGILGGDFALGLDIFPGEPFVVSGELSVGAVGQAFVVQARGSVGVIVDSVEIYAGYDYEALFAGGAQVDLGGPMLGVRAWL